MKSNIYCISEPNNPPQISGNGSKGLMIVINESDNSENLATLQGLVKAIKFDIEEDVSIVSCNENQISLNPIISTGKYKTIILIGIDPDQVGFAIQAKKNFFYNMENFSILLVDSLKDMNADKAKKMAFWQNLQAKFLS